MQNSKFDLISSILKINLGLFGISVITQFIFLNFLYNKGHDLMFKDEVISDKAFIVIGLNICLIASLVLYSFFIQNRASPHLLGHPISLLEKISILLSSFSAIAATCLISLCTLNNEFKDSINLPFGLKLHFNWSFSERFGYVKNILRESGVPEPVDLELKARETTSMDSIRDLAESIEQSHIESLRAKIESKTHDLVNNSPPGIMNDMNNWIHDNYVNIAIGCIFVCACAFTISIFAYVSISDKADKLNKEIVDIQANIDTLDKSVVDLAGSRPDVLPGGSKEEIYQEIDNLGQEIAKLTRFTREELDRSEGGIKESVRESFQKFGRDLNPRFDTLDGIRGALVKSGELSPSQRPYTSAQEAVDNIAFTTFNNQKAIRDFTTNITTRMNEADQYNDAAITRVSETLNRKIDLKFRELGDLTGVLEKELNELTEKVDASAVTEQAATVVSAISESGL